MLKAALSGLGVAYLIGPHVQEHMEGERLVRVREDSHDDGEERSRGR